MESRSREFLISTGWISGLALLVLACCGAPALAQTPLIVPRDMANREGVSSSSLPFGTNQPVRFQCIYDNEELQISNPMAIRGIAVRADHQANQAIPGKQFLVMNMLISTTNTAAAESGAEFDRNHGLDAVVCMRDGRISLPAQPALPTGPRPCNILLMFDAPVFFDLSPYRLPGRRQPGLVIEIQISLQPPGAYDIDTPFICSSELTNFGPNDPRCVTSRPPLPGRPLTLNSSDSVKAGGSVTYTISEMPSREPFGLIIGSRAHGTWQQIPLPVDLTFLGAPGCYLLTDWLFTSIALSDDAGIGRVVLPIPPGREFVDKKIFAQAICRDLAANRSLFVTSRGLNTRICGPLGIARVFFAGSSQANTGQRTYGSAMILELLP